MALKLTPKERAFAAAYVKDPEKSAAQAARTAGYGVPRVAGPRALKRAHVKALIASLEAAARKRVRVVRPRMSKVEVLPPMLPRVLPAGPLEHHAVASRAEVLAMATNAIRTTPGQFLDRDGQLFDREKVRNAPPGVLKDLSKDETGDWRLRFSDPIQAGKLLLDDHYREHGDEDPMAGPRQVVNILMLQGSDKDREAFDAMARRMADLGQNGGGDGDG